MKIISKGKISFIKIDSHNLYLVHLTVRKKLNIVITMNTLRYKNLDAFFQIKNKY